MTDEDLTPEQEEVRRLLAEARHDGPMPASVAARLDGVLADLAAEPARVASVTDLATRRRRATSLLVAAAAVVAIGVGVGQVVDTGIPAADELAGSTREDSGAATDAEAEAAEPEAPDEGAGAASAPQQAESGQASDQAFPELDRSALAEDVSALRRQRLSAPPVEPRGAAGAAGATCLSETWGEGRFVPVRYDGLPAVVVFRTASGDTQVADLFLCGDSEPRRSVTLPAP